MTNCETIQDELSAYLDNELSPTEQATVATHLKGCTRCQAVLAELTEVHTVLGDLPKQTAPVTLPHRIHLQIRPKSVISIGTIWMSIAAIVMVCVMVFLVLPSLQTNEGSTPGNVATVSDGHVAPSTQLKESSKTPPAESATELRKKAAEKLSKPEEAAATLSDKDIKSKRLRATPRKNDFESGDTLQNENEDENTLTLDKSKQNVSRKSAADSINGSEAFGAPPSAPAVADSKKAMPKESLAENKAETKVSLPVFENSNVAKMPAAPVQVPLVASAKDAIATAPAKADKLETLGRNVETAMKAPLREREETVLKSANIQETVAQLQMLSKKYGAEIASVGAEGSHYMLDSKGDSEHDGTSKKEAKRLAIPEAESGIGKKEVESRKGKGIAGAKSRAVQSQTFMIKVPISQKEALLAELKTATVKDVKLPPKLALSASSATPAESSSMAAKKVDGAKPSDEKSEKYEKSSVDMCEIIIVIESDSALSE